MEGSFLKVEHKRFVKCYFCKFLISVRLVEGTLVLLKILMNFEYRIVFFYFEELFLLFQFFWNWLIMYWNTYTCIFVIVWTKSPSKTVQLFKRNVIFLKMSFILQSGKFFKELKDIPNKLKKVNFLDLQVHWYFIVLQTF